MTSKLTREQATDKELQMLIDSHEKGTAMFLRVDAYYLMAKELQERRKAERDSEPVAWEVKGILCHTLDEANKYVGIPEPLYSHAQQPVVPPIATVESTYPDVQTGWQDAEMYAEGWNACRAAMLNGGKS